MTQKKSVKPLSQRFLEKYIVDENGVVGEMSAQWRNLRKVHDVNSN